MKRIALTIIALFAVISCSTTKLLPAGTYRLVSNKVGFEGEKLSPTEVTPYIRQQSNKGIIFGWSPSLSIYNWSNGSGEGINRFWETVGDEPVVFDSTQVANSCTNIAAHLTSIGYYGSKVRGEVSYKGRLARVKYIVTPGKRYPIDSIVYDVPGGEFGEVFRADSAHMTVHVGDFLSEEALENETERGAAVFRDKGFYDFSKNNYFFEADTLSERTRLYYRIHGYTRGEDPSLDAPINKFRIGRVNVLHPEGLPFRESLLRKYNRIQPGALYNERMITSTYNRFSSLKVFNNVTVETVQADSQTVDVNVILSGTEQLGFKANLEASTNASGLLGFSPQLNFFHKNLFHGGEWLDLGFTGNWQWIPNPSESTSESSTELGVSASLSFPRLLGYSIGRIRGDNIPRTEFKVSFNYQNRPEFQRFLTTFNFGYSGQMGRNYFYQIQPLRLNVVKVSAVSFSYLETLVSYPYLWDSFEDQIDAGVRLMLYHTTDPAVVPKTAYHSERVSLSLSGNALSLLDPVLPVYDHPVLTMHSIFGLPYKQYVRGELNLARVLRFGWNDNQQLAMHLVAGAGFAYGNSIAMPFEEQFYCGGANSMRGWQTRTLGPGNEGLNALYRIPSQTGDLKLEADVEYRFPSVWKLEFALFGEVGNVWQIGTTPITWSSLAADWGAGIRVNLDFILIRIDAGFRIHDPARAEGDRWVHPRDWLHGSSAIHFGVGYPF